MQEFILEAHGIKKTFPGVQALKNVDFDLRPGEVHALLGENGAGKSTLVKILTGIYQEDEGLIKVNGQVVSIASPQAAFDLGISVIHQELNLIPDLDVATNIFLGRLPTSAFGKRIGYVDWKRTYAEAESVLKRMGVNIPPKALIRRIGVSQAQLVEIAKAISRNAHIIFMDEPTSSLSPKEQKELFKIIRGLKEKNVAIVYISHRLEEVMGISDRITVLRDGRKVGTMETQSTSVDDLIKMMVGQTLKERYPKAAAPIGEVLLEVKGLERRGVLHNINFTVRRGEILGITGLVGAGRTELARAIFGADRIDAGEIKIEGKVLNIRTPADAINSGIALLTEDRKNEGLLLHLSVKENISISALNCKEIMAEYLGPGGIVKQNLVHKNSQSYVEKLGIKTPSLTQLVKNLSGGNQQKVIIGKWLSTKAKIFIFDEPTKGIDVGSKAEIYRLMESLAMNGAAIIMISSELPEVLSISDRIIVMRRGRIVAELDPKKANEELIVKYAAVEVQDEQYGYSA